jgi:hypothetical protein
LLNVTILEEKTPGEPSPPEFVSVLNPISVAKNFTAGSGFDTIKYDLPQIIDPNGLELKPVVITNMNEFLFITFDNAKNTVTVDPNGIDLSLVDTLVELKVKLENIDGLSDESILYIIVQNTAPVEEELEPKSEEEEEKAYSAEVDDKDSSNSTDTSG